MAVMSDAGAVSLAPEGVGGPEATGAAAFIRRDTDGTAHLDLMVDNVKCAKCIRDVEKGVTERHPVSSVRLNFSTRRLHVVWRGEAELADAIVTTLDRLGFPAKPLNIAHDRPGADREQRRLLSCLGVAGFASANVMLLSVSVWAGSDMAPATRDLMHGISGLIALPAVAYAGRPFFFSALTALRGRRINMDVPISLAVILASILSIVKTVQSGDHAYFDAAVMLLFFLLIGRYLDYAMRAKARSAAQDLLALQAASADVLSADGQRVRLPVSAVRPGDLLFVAPGDRVPVDGVVATGEGSLDVSLLTGESTPVSVAPGDGVHGGALNLGALLQVTASQTSASSLMSEIISLMETAEQGRARYRRLADRAAGIYAPLVHALAAMTFAGWWILGGAWGIAAEHAIAVLIITCPCALGLAVPVVQVIASGHLFRRGILVKAADGLERLAEVSAMAFDKTGTLTNGHLTLVHPERVSPEDLELAASLARASRHPLSKALVRAAGEGPVLENVREEPGLGLEATLPLTDEAHVSAQHGSGDGIVRLGRAEWCSADPAAARDSLGGPVLWLRRPDGSTVAFSFEDTLRADAPATIATLREAGVKSVLLSGDRSAVVEKAAKSAGVAEWAGDLLPQDKLARLDTLRDGGAKVAMVGDGLNDAPALAHAHASLSPSSAADISQNAADFVFQGSRLGAVVTAWRTAKAARLLVLQNFGLAALYNMIAIPLAVSGMVTPLIAAIAMSASSVIVTLNALRLGLLAGGGAPSVGEPSS